MVTEGEWIQHASEQGINADLLEVAEDYIDHLSRGEMTWRDYYREVNTVVYQQQPNSG